MRRLVKQIRLTPLVCLTAGMILFAPLAAKAQEASRLDWSVAVAVGETFAVGLPSNATTGYTWQMTQEPSLVVARFLENEELTRDCAEGAVGCGGIDVWRFQAVAAGATVVQLSYSRVWESTEPARQAT
ncbi:MAG: protease inhibitor I42 family protein, partial [Deltaproteobacteria bacterium]|nr:protease inhibitor I42 family protein [Deltaproteobacteria bacterium]